MGWHLYLGIWVGTSTWVYVENPRTEEPEKEGKNGARKGGIHRLNCPVGGQRVVVGESGGASCARDPKVDDQMNGRNRVRNKGAQTRFELGVD
jgi:hypothetical protein